jgi:hypothetical protein
MTKVLKLAPRLDRKNNNHKQSYQGKICSTIQITGPKITSTKKNIGHQKSYIIIMLLPLKSIPFMKSASNVALVVSLWKCASTLDKFYSCVYFKSGDSLHLIAGYGCKQ